MMKITNANWDRVNLYLTVDKTSINEAYLLDERNNKFILPLKENEITINMNNLILKAFITLHLIEDACVYFQNMNQNEQINDDTNIFTKQGE